MLPPGRHLVQVAAVALQVVDGRKVTGRGQLFIQSPKAADEALGVLRDRLGKVPTRGRDRANYSDRPLSAAERLHPACPLIKLGQAGGEIRRESLFCRHLFQTAGDFSQCLRPP